MKTQPFSLYELALHRAALQAELDGFSTLAATLRSMLDQEVRS